MRLLHLHTSNEGRSTGLPALIAAFTALLCVTIAGCSGAGSPVASAIPQPQDVARTTATPTPIPFKFQTVDDPNSNFNKCMGINDLSKIVGVYGGGSGSNIPEGYTSDPPYTQFRPINFPGAQGTTPTSVTNNKLIAGYVAAPQQLLGTWGFLRANGVWSLLKNHKEGSNQYAVTEILGMNDSKMAVGFFLDPYGKTVPFELNVVTETFINLSPPNSAGSEGTGINGKGNVTGTFWTAGGKTQGFYLQTGTYYPFSYPHAQLTWANSLNWQDQIGGYYEDGSGGIHGFILTDPTAGSQKQIWQSVDEPNAAGTTVITGINNHDDICGWYVDKYGNTNGFVATPKGS